MIKQISVFLENRPGQLAEFVRYLQKDGIDLRALSLAETESFGIARLITDDAMGSINALNEAGYICRLTDMVAVEMEDRPGARQDHPLRMPAAYGKPRHRLRTVPAILIKETA